MAISAKARLVFRIGLCRTSKVYGKPPRCDHGSLSTVETDSSEWSVGGVLMQVDDTGIMKPCAFFSKKNSPAECNYEIYDKEMLAIIHYLEEWDAELRSVKEFQIQIDHKNLEYFMMARQLTERQMRWSR